MKKFLVPLCVLSVSISAGLFLTGCSSGGGGGGGRFPFPGGVGQDPDPNADPDPAVAVPGQGWGAAAPGAAQYVESKGLVMLMQPNGGSTPLPGVRINVESDGVNIDSTVSDQRGIYRLRLKRARQNAITASKPGYSLSPETAFVTPFQQEALPVIEARIRGMQIPGAINNPVRDPVGGWNQSSGLRGVVVGQISVDPTAGALDALLDVNVLIRDASSNRVIQTVRTNNQNRFSYEGQVGQEIIIEPTTRGNVRWYPSSRRIRVARQQQEVSFQWRADVRHSSPSAPQNPRPVFRRPSWFQQNP
ncbi:MAG: hypothetical protein WEB60_07900 [Terrimicrobiaceae bacterium]